jgi:hypothetical protein
VRTTPALDDDVAAMLTGVRNERRIDLKEAVNEALRDGLRRMVAPPRRRRPFRTSSVSLGRCPVNNLDNVGEALAIAEVEWFREDRVKARCG